MVSLSNRRKFKTLTSLAILAALNGANAHAENPYNKSYNMSQAASVHLTHRGEELFRTNMAELLKRAGADITSGTMQSYSYEAKETLNLSKLPAEYRPHLRLLQTLRTKAKEWLEGFQLNDPKFSAELTGVHYQLGQLGSSLRFDREMTRALGPNQGIAVSLMLEIPEIRIDIDAARARDRNNPFLGSFGFNRAYLELNDRSIPLRAEVTAAVKVKRDGGIDLKTISVRTNFEQTRFESGFRRAARGEDGRTLVLPRVQIRVGSQTSTLLTGEIERMLLAKRPEIVRMLQQKAKELVETKLPELADNYAWHHLSDGFGTVKEIDAPGIDAFAFGTPFEWGLRLENLALSNDFVNLKLAGYVRDPLVTWDERAPPFARKSSPRLDGMDKDRYDLALMVNTDIVGRVIDLAWQRGNLRTVGAGSSQVPMLEKPRFRVISRDRAKFHVKIQESADGFQKLALKSPFEVEVDLIVRLRKSRSGKAFDLVADRIDVSTARIDDRFIRANALRDEVYDGLRERLDELNADYRRNEKLIVDNVQIPTELYGLHLKIEHMEFDPSGFIGIFLSYVGNGLAPSGSAP